MAKVNFKEVSLLQMDGSTQTVDIREEACKNLYWHHDKEVVMLGQRLWQGETELSPDEEKLIRQMIDPWPWVTRDAIEKQLAAK